jgi:Transposase.
MSKFVPEKEHLRQALLFLFNQKKTAAESHRLLVLNTLHWIEHVRHGFDNLKMAISMWKWVRALVGHKVRRWRMQAALDDDLTQTQRQLAEALNVSQESSSGSWRAMGKINKIGEWVSHNFNDRQISIAKSLVKYCFNAKKESNFCTELWLVTKCGFYFESPKWRESWLCPAKPRPNRFGRKITLCVWWDQSGIVYCKLLEPGETVNAQRYPQEMINLNHALNEKRPEWAKRHGKVILLHDNAPSHTSKLAKDTLSPPL